MVNIIKVRGTPVTVKRVLEQYHVCLTDIEQHKDANATDDLIRIWLRNRNTIEPVGLGE